MIENGTEPTDRWCDTSEAREYVTGIAGADYLASALRSSDDTLARRVAHCLAARGRMPIKTVSHVHAYNVSVRKYY